MIKKLLKIALSVIVILAMLLPSIQVLATIMYDFTTFTEVDPSTLYTITANKITFTATDLVSESRVVKSDIIASGADFEYRDKYSKTSQSLGAGSGEIWTGAAEGVLAFQSSANYSLMMYAFASNAPSLKLQETYNGTSYTSAGYTTAIGSVYYRSLSRVNGIGYLKIYSDSSYTTLLNSDNLTLHGSPAYDYTYGALQNYGAGTTTYFQGYIENLIRTDNPESTVFPPNMQMFGATYDHNMLSAAGLMVSSSSGNLTQRGFRVSSDNITWDLPGFSEFGNWQAGVSENNLIAGFYSWTSSNSYPLSPYYYIQAFGVVKGEVGFSNIIKIIGNSMIGGNITGVSVTGSSSGTGIRQNLNGILNNQSLYPSTEFRFSWGTSSNATGNGYAYYDTRTQGQITYTFERDFLPNTVYFWKASAIVNGTEIFSPIYTFTTTTAPSIILNLPIVKTLPSTSMASFSFVANGELTSLGDYWVIERGFEISRNKMNIDASSSASGNFSIGAFSASVNIGAGTFLNASTKLVYVRVYAIGMNDPNLNNPRINGEWIYTDLTSITSGNGTGIVGVIPNTISSLVLQFARYQGLDNPMGHWAFLLETMLVILLLFGILVICIYVKTKEFGIALKIIVWILLVAEIVDIGMFLFTLWLGIWPLILLASAVLVIIFIVIAVISKGGG